MLKVDVPDRPHFWHQHEEAATIRAKALELIEIDDLADARLKLADLSAALGKLLGTTGVPPSFGKQVQQLHCPMYLEGQGGTIWLQVRGEATNPYMGSRMPQCFDKRIAVPVTGAPSEAQPSKRDREQETDQAPPGRQNVRVSEQAQVQIDALVASYLELQRLLAQNRMEGAAEPLARIRNAARNLADSRHEAVAGPGDRIAEVAAKSQPDLQRLRTAFKEISDALIGLVEAAPASAQVAPHLRHTRCPMVKADWLQVQETVANPYSPAMPKCGTFVKLITPAEPAAQPRTLQN
jgi:hypothetical protein